MNRQTYFANSMKKLRKEKGLSQAKLAQKIGVSRESIATYEICTREPSLLTICNIADALGVAPNEMLGYKNDDRKVIEIKYGKRHEIVAKEIEM